MGLAFSSLTKYGGGVRFSSESFNEREITVSIMTPNHSSFKSVQSKIARKGGYSMKAAGAILANASRNASPAAKRKNPALRKVKG